jgi:hypothetical protein
MGFRYLFTISTWPRIVIKVTFFQCILLRDITVARIFWLSQSEESKNSAKPKKWPSMIRNVSLVNGQTDRLALPYIHTMRIIRSSIRSQGQQQHCILAETTACRGDWESSKTWLYWRNFLNGKPEFSYLRTLHNITTHYIYDALMTSHAD